MAAVRLNWVRKETSVIYTNSTTGEKICTAIYQKADNFGQARFELLINDKVVTDWPDGIDAGIQNITLQTCEWLALAIAQHWEDRRGR